MMNQKSPEVVINVHPAQTGALDSKWQMKWELYNRISWMPSWVIGLQEPPGKGRRSLHLPCVVCLSGVVQGFVKMKEWYSSLELQ